MKRFAGFSHYSHKWTAARKRFRHSLRISSWKPPAGIHRSVPEPTGEATPALLAFLLLWLLVGLPNYGPGAYLPREFGPPHPARHPQS